MDLSPISREAMRAPVSAKVLAGSLFAALLLNLLPWQGTALLLRPDFLLLVVVYWTVQEPRSIGQGIAFALALVMDVADSALLGQHAMVYVFAVFLAQTLRLRILQLNPVEQALHVGAILMFGQVVSLLLNFMVGREFPGFAMFVAPVLGAALWPLVGKLTGLQRFRRPPTTLMR